MLKIQYFGYLIQRADSLENTLMLRKIEVRRRNGEKRMRWLDGITESMSISLGNFRSCGRTGKLGELQSMGLQRPRHN